MFNIWCCADSEAMLAAKGQISRGPGAPYALTVNERKGDRYVAILFLEGLLTRYGMQDGEFVGTSTLALRSLVERLTVDPACSGALFMVNSPGGVTDATIELHDAIVELSAIKPTHAHVDGCCCSAAIFAVAGVRKITATRGSFIGSIGVYSVIVDSSQLLEKIGIKVHVIRSHELKGIGVPGAPLTEPQLASMKRHIDHHFTAFKTAVKDGRKLTPTLLETVSTGEVWPAARAQQLHLIDQVCTFKVAQGEFLRTSAPSPHAVLPHIREMMTYQPVPPTTRKIVSVPVQQSHGLNFGTLVSQQLLD